MNKIAKTSAVFAVLAATVAATGCASLSQKELKAPCGPLAGMTDPCGDRVPINKDHQVAFLFLTDELSA